MAGIEGLAYEKYVPSLHGLLSLTSDERRFTRTRSATYTIGRVARSVFVTGDELSNAEQPGRAGVIKGSSETLFGEDAEQGGGFYWEAPRERGGRSSFCDWGGYQGRGRMG